jgi:hypothetical protein
VKSVFHVTLRDRATDGAIVTSIRFKSKRRDGPFEVGPAIVMAPPGVDTTWEDVFTNCEYRLVRLAELLDQRRRRRQP